ncbi:MAG: GntR family transcriptional regulator [Acidobacteria bacterium]|nr:GntR family transcriptional regulator [Acidobacteriota bacterium]MCB9399338.1 GntR family transcriptional regulator [Acidobacteriota bacterium]
MEIFIDLEDPNPLFAQLIQQIKDAILKGDLEPGAPLPSIRQLANELELNAKTVAKAYQLLERDSVIQTRGYRGTFVHPDAIANCGQDIAQLVLDKIGEAIETCREAGATDSEIRIAFSHAMNRTSRRN